MTMPQELFLQPLMRQQAPDQNRAAPFHSPQMPPPFFQRNAGGQQASISSPLSPRSFTYDINVMLVVADEMHKHNVTRANLANVYVQFANLHKQNRALQTQITTLQESLERKEALFAMSRSSYKSIRIDTNVGENRVPDYAMAGPQQRSKNGERQGHNHTMEAPDASMCPPTEEDGQEDVVYPTQTEYSGLGLM